MKKRQPLFPFENQMTKTQTVLGWIYLPLHVLVLPLLLSMYAQFSPDPVSETAINLIYYAIGIVFALTVMFRFLRSGFDGLMDRLVFCIITALLALVIDYALTTVATVILMLFEESIVNPNNAELVELAGKDYGAIKALAIFIAPIVEEILFRGVVFGSLRTRSRGWAYLVSVLLFSFYHVWQYAAAYSDPALLIYALQYIPVSYVLAWCYERTGSIWTPIFFHMGFNALSFFVLTLA